MRVFILIILVLSIQLASFAQNTQESLDKEAKKSIEAVFVEKAPKIDGILDDISWQSANIARDFIMFRPGTKTPEPDNQKTLVKIVYDNEAIYIGAYLYDDDVASIPMQFSSRDNFAQSDFFGVVLNPFNDGINDTEFFISSAGAQADAKVTANGEDFSWSAVWESAVSINNNGWVIEMKIPYSALRFSNKQQEAWGLNFHRLIQNKKEQYSWNFIDKTNGNITEYAGLLTGINNINPPIRLSFYPYAQTSYTYFNNEGDLKATAGLDIKYGINESFTLDATLIPDFGQVAFDDVVLNLGPFEQQYDEKRAFFTEGTELFEKGDLFYSRRVGSTPISYYDVYDSLNTHEEVIENPEKTKMLNAIKLSGRTKGGLGIGVFNAFTENTQATITDSETSNSRTFTTDPFTNYNVLVLDHQFRKNSSVSFVNSNVFRQGKSFYNANVSSALLDLRTKNNKYSFETDLSLSNKFYEHETINGFKGKIGFDKVSGAHRFGANVEISDNNYDKNDLGIQLYKNYYYYEASYSYRIFEPKGKLNSFGIYSWAHLVYQQKPYDYMGNGIGAAIFATNTKFLSFGGNLNFSFGDQNDYYETRVEGRFHKTQEPKRINLWLSTDYRKKLALDTSVNGAIQFGLESPQKSFGFRISPRYRFTDKFQMIYSINLNKQFNEKGYVEILENEDIIFGNRDSKTITNNLTGTLNLSTKSAFSLSFRHYWSPVTYDYLFYTLQDDGTLVENTHFENYNVNFNSWNFDLSYSLEFAPGSQLVALYRNSIFNDNGQSDLSFTNNIDYLFQEPLSQQFSLKFIYYLDYNKLKNWF